MSLPSSLLNKVACSQLEREGVLVTTGALPHRASSSANNSSEAAATKRFHEKIEQVAGEAQAWNGTLVDFLIERLPISEWTIGDVCSLIAHNCVGGPPPKAKDVRQLTKYIEGYASTSLRDDRVVLPERHLQSRVFEVRDYVAAVVARKNLVAGADEGCVFCAMGDWGMVRDWDALASTLSAVITRSGTRPNFILAVGDNVYPQGVSSVESAVLAAWRETFVLAPAEGKKSNPAMSVPWYLILGNHDYRCPPKTAPVTWPLFPNPPPYSVRNATYIANPQVDFSYSAQYNPEFMWRMPGNNYTFSRKVGVNGNCVVDFFGIDTCGVQYAVRRADPEAYGRLKVQVRRLEQELKDSKAKWKIVFGHHPLYTVGNGHQDEARCLRGEQCASVMDAMNTTVEAPLYEGIGLEGALLRGGAHLYIAGHDHASQYTCTRYVTKTNPVTSMGALLHHVVCGAPIHPGYYGGALFPTSSKLAIDDASTSDSEITRCNNALCGKCSLPPPRCLSDPDPFRSMGKSYQHFVEWENSTTVAVANVAVEPEEIHIQFTAKSGYVIKSIKIVDHLSPPAATAVGVAAKPL